MYCWLAGCWLLAACYFCYLFPFPFSFHLQSQFGSLLESWPAFLPTFLVELALLEQALQPQRQESSHPHKSLTLRMSLQEWTGMQTLLNSPPTLLRGLSRRMCRRPLGRPTPAKIASSMCRDLASFICPMLWLLKSIPSVPRCGTRTWLQELHLSMQSRWHMATVWQPTPSTCGRVAPSQQKPLQSTHLRCIPVRSHWRMVTQQFFLHFWKQQSKASILTVHLCFPTSQKKPSFAWVLQGYFTFSWGGMEFQLVCEAWKRQWQHWGWMTSELTHQSSPQI